MKKFNDFLAAKGITAEVFATKSAEEMAALYNEYNAESQKALEGMIADKADKGEIEKAVAELRDSQMEQMRSEEQKSELQTPM